MTAQLDNIISLILVLIFVSALVYRMKRKRKTGIDSVNGGTGNSESSKTK